MISGGSESRDYLSSDGRFGWKVLLQWAPLLCAHPVAQPSAQSAPPSSTIDNHGEDPVRLIFLVETRTPPCNANCVDC
jgi:hypothetical protein